MEFYYQIMHHRQYCSCNYTSPLVNQFRLSNYYLGNKYIRKHNVSYLVENLMKLSKLYEFCNQHRICLWSRRTGNLYSTGRGKTGKTDAPIENELDIVRNWNFIHLVILAYFFARESFKLICIFYDFEAPPFENR